MQTSKSQSRFGRSTETERILHVLNEWQAAPAKTNWFGILGISGYGGVGKSYLLNGILSEQKLDERDSFTVKLDGSNKPILMDFIAMVDAKLAPRTVNFRGANPKDDQFPETRKLISCQRKLTSKVKAEVEKSKVPDTVKAAAKTMYRFTPWISKIPKAGPIIATLLKTSETFKLEENVEPAIDLIKNLRTLNPSRRSPFSKLHVSPLEKLTTDPLGAISEAYETDVRARLVGYKGQKIFKLLHRKAKGVNRLLLVIDDYESTGDALGDLLVNHLFQRFQDAPYPVLVVIIGRDDLWDTAPEFSKLLSRFVQDRIALAPFTEEEGVLYLKQSGYNTKEALALYNESNGYPFVLSLLADFKSNQDDRPATFYQQFYERTTQWMTDQQKNWLLPLCYLDSVNHGSIEKMLPDTSPTVVMDWFRREASVRDINSPTFRVDPYIKKMLLQHQSNLAGKKEHNRLIKEGRAALAGN